MIARRFPVHTDFNRDLCGNITSLKSYTRTTLSNTLGLNIYFHLRSAKHILYMLPVLINQSTWFSNSEQQYCRLRERDIWILSSHTYLMVLARLTLTKIMIVTMSPSKEIWNDPTYLPLLLLLTDILRHWWIDLPGCAASEQIQTLCYRDKKPLLSQFYASCFSLINA